MPAIEFIAEIAILEEKVATLEAERDGAVKRAVTAEKDRKSARETWEKADAMLSEVLPENARLKRDLADTEAERDELTKQLEKIQREGRVSR